MRADLFIRDTRKDGRYVEDKFYPPSSKWPVNTANSSIFIEVEEISQSFFLSLLIVTLSLLSVGQQGALYHSARKVTE